MFQTAGAEARPQAGSLSRLVRPWTPVAMGLMVMGLLSGLRSPEGIALAAAGGSRSLLAAAFSNQFYAAYLPAVDHSPHNQSATKMRWTNVHTPPSTIGFFAQPQTNPIGMQP